MIPAGTRKTVSDKANRAAALYLDQSIEVRALIERFGVSRGSIWKAIDRLRRQRAEAGGER